MESRAPLKATENVLNTTTSVPSKNIYGPNYHKGGPGNEWTPKGFI